MARPPFTPGARKRVPGRRFAISAGPGPSEASGGSRCTPSDNVRARSRFETVATKVERRASGRREASRSSVSCTTPCSRCAMALQYCGSRRTGLPGAVAYAGWWKTIFHRAGSGRAANGSPTMDPMSGSSTLTVQATGKHSSPPNTRPARSAPRAPWRAARTHGSSRACGRPPRMACSCRSRPPDKSRRTQTRLEDVGGA